MRDGLVPSGARSPEGDRAGEASTYIIEMAPFTGDP